MNRDFICDIELCLYTSFDGEKIDDFDYVDIYILLVSRKMSLISN